MKFNVLDFKDKNIKMVQYAVHQNNISIKRDTSTNI